MASHLPVIAAVVAAAVAAYALFRFARAACPP